MTDIKSTIARVRELVSTVTADHDPVSSEILGIYLDRWLTRAAAWVKDGDQ